MRKSMFVALMIVGASTLFVLPAVTTGQFPQQGGKKGKGGFGGDPSALFDRLARGQNSISISQTNVFRDQLKQFAQERGITGDQITRQQFTDFQDYLKTKLTGAPQGPGSGGMTPGGGFGGPGGKGNKGGFGSFDPNATPFGGPGAFPGGPGAFPGGPGAFPGGNQFGGPGGKGNKGGLPAGMTLNPEAVNDFADREFKRYDANGDMKLNKDEMPPQLLAVFTTWDKNGDTFIDQAEYRAYYAARINEGGNLDRAVATIIIEEDELERKAVVYGARNLPRNIPSWFKDLDRDNDGQVALYEWRAGKKPLEEFPNWDLNDDGFIIPEEAMRTQEILAKNNPRGGEDGASFSGGFSTGPFGGMGDGTERRQFGSGKKGGDGAFGGFGGMGGDRSSFGGGKKGADRGDGENPFPGFGGKKNGKKNGGGNGN